jgi:hypothetical protein
MRMSTDWYKHGALKGGHGGQRSPRICFFFKIKPGIFFSKSGFLGSNVFGYPNKNFNKKLLKKL